MKAKVILIISAILFCTAAVIADETAITIYNDNFAVVKQNRNINFDKGINTIKYADVASAIEPESVKFDCISAAGKIRILEQNYEYDLVGSAALMKKYIDSDISVELKGSGSDAGKTINGTLLAMPDNNLIIKNPDGFINIISYKSIENIVLLRLPEGLVTRPTLIWLADAQVSGLQDCKITYTTGRISWAADYSAVLSADEKSLDLSGWVTITNNSGTCYKNAALKLIAGDVRKIAKPQIMYKAANIRDDFALGMAEADGFEEKSFMEYHLYTLGRKSTINNNQVKQIEFIAPVAGVPAEKIYIYKRTEKPDKVQIKFEFENKKDYALGIALPKGKVRVFKKDSDDDNLEFVGEDMIKHTPKDEKITLYIGNAFDVTAEYKMLDSKTATRYRWESHSIELHNRKDTDVVVLVDEKFPQWRNWKIDESNFSYTKKDSNTARFVVNIAANETAELKYSATQRW